MNAFGILHADGSGDDGTDPSVLSELYDELAGASSELRAHWDIA